MNAQPPKRRVPKGDALDLSDDDLDRESEVTSKDVQAALAFWRKYAKPEDRDMLEPKKRKDRE